MMPMTFVDVNFQTSSEGKPSVASRFMLCRSGYRFALVLAISGRPASRPDMAVGIGDLMSPDSAEYGSRSLSPMPVETGQ